MIVNYRRSRFERLTGMTADDALPGRLRRPLAVLVATVAGISSLHVFTTCKITALDGQTARAHADLAALRVPLSALDAVEAAQAARVRRAADKQMVRDANTKDLNRFALIGNQIPPAAALVSINSDGIHTRLEGRCADLPALSVVIDALDHTSAKSKTKLLSVRDDPARHGLSFALEVDERA